MHRSPALRVVEPVAIELADGTLELSSSVPRTRGDCPKERPCPHVRCSHHTWLAVGEDRPGRRHDGRHPPTTLRPVWFDEEGNRRTRAELPVSCVLDVVEAHPDGLSARAIASILGLEDKRRVEQIVTAALGELHDEPEIEDDEPVWHAPNLSLAGA